MVPTIIVVGWDTDVHCMIISDNWYMNKKLMKQNRRKQIRKLHLNFNVEDIKKLWTNQKLKYHNVTLSCRTKKV